MIIWTREAFSCREKTGFGDDSRSIWLLSTTFAECLLASLDRVK